MLQKQFNVLAVDNEYLVAMDIEFILTKALGCDVTIGTFLGENNGLKNREFDLAVMDGDHPMSDIFSLIERMGWNIDSFLLSTFDLKRATDFPGLNISATVMKPFVHDNLVSATEAAFRSLIRNTPAN